MPAPDQSAECSLIQPMKTFAALALVLVVGRLVVMKKWCELAHDGRLVADGGHGAMP